MHRRYALLLSSPVSLLSGWVVLGDLTLMCPVGHQRIQSVIHNGFGVDVRVVGSPGEHVSITTLAPVRLSGSKPEWTVVVQNVTINAGGAAELTFGSSGM